jgi:rRNA maturation RNase YbeY
MADVYGNSISVILTDDDGIRSINNRYRRKNRPTDVISFAYRENQFPKVDGNVETLGDVYISLERADAQAAQYGAEPAEELLRLMVHGILHLAGYDHERSKRDEAVMREKEMGILTILTRRLPLRLNRT